MKYSLLWIMLKLIALLCRILPYRGRKYLGHCFGKLGYSFTESRREVAAGNLSRAFPGMEKNEVDNIVRDMYINLGYTLVEFFQTYKLAQEGIERYVEIENGKNLEQAYNRGQGVIFYSAHFGNWEWLGSFISALDYPLVAVARRQKSPIHEMVEKIREITGTRIIYRKDGSIRESLRCLRRGECLYLIGDQEARSRGWKTEFFGRPSSTFNGAVKLAARTGAAIVPVFTVREKLERHRLVCREPVYVEKDSSRKEQEKILQHLTDICEETIKKHKEQWMWLHRRWKTYN